MSGERLRGGLGFPPLMLGRSSLYLLRWDFVELSFRRVDYAAFRRCGRRGDVVDVADDVDGDVTLVVFCLISPRLFTVLWYQSKGGIYCARLSLTAKSNL